MNLLVVIPCLNEAAHLGGLIAQLLCDPSIDLLVVADGGSIDGSQRIVQDLAAHDPRVRLINNSARIQSAGINRAVAQYGDGYRWLLRVDAHCHYPDGYASTLLRAADAQSASAVVVPMLTQGKCGFQLAVATAQNSVLGTGGSAHRHLGEGRLVDHGHHALLRLDLFRKIGGYCEAMPCNEDAELDHRQTLAGGRIWLEPTAAIVYFPRSRPGALWRQYYRYGVGRARNLRRHRMRPHLRQLAPLAVPAALTLLPLAAWHPIFALPVIAWLLLCLLLGAAIGTRKGGGWRMAAGIAAAIMHAAWAFGFIAEMIGNPRSIAPRYGLLSR
ncbi:glycosyltransferase family 2 protein [Sphingomonas qomolangmaensis]|uniref:Glycosyltransferase family 2 protein n=1 Tax=Sphingomonas qomolangmaensis TaxID=2918765 RepID=A0ABY5L615_9SPHN|nr:glycosyltransferase family 2 protein [Sphingomonas qomolangmaensis]UUL82390.1 glycosyltransferase family 2 protein [Sphingomonas qomolangmaensis]